MNGRSFLIDTNIALYLLSGNKTIADIIDGSQLYISFVTELELLGYKQIFRQGNNRILKYFLKECIIIDINEEIKKHTIQIKQRNQMKLPDTYYCCYSFIY
jgi:predicted nucleic acid-binding protein